MGILNVTPDSFSDGGRWAETDAAIQRGMQLASQGADIVDVCGESTRPGADRVPADAEQARVIPVIRELARNGVTVSVDTLHAETARAAIEAGAAIINDVSGGLADPAMASVAAETGSPYIAMHWRGHAQEMDRLAEYTDVVQDVRRELEARVDALLAAGVAPGQIILDPGLGFAKQGAHNWELLARLDVLQALGFPVMVGASRKRFLAGLLPTDAPVSARDLPTAVISVLSAQAGAWAVRVHDVETTLTALAVLARLDSDRMDA
jgi:dihydropteroate synthase